MKNGTEVYVDNARTKKGIVVATLPGRVCDYKIIKERYGYSTNVIVVKLEKD